MELKKISHSSEYTCQNAFPTENHSSKFSLLLKLQASIFCFLLRSVKAKVGRWSTSDLGSSKMDKSNKRIRPLEYKDIATLVLSVTRYLEKMLCGHKC